MVSKWASFTVWAAVAASLLFWALRLLVPSTAAPTHTVTVSAAGLARGDLARVLGAEARPTQTQEAAAEPAADRRFQLVGVVAPRGAQAGSQGVALIAVDGKPPKAYRVGAAVDGETVLQSVSIRGAALGPRGGAATVALSTPALAPAATGVLPRAVPGGAPPPPAQAGFNPPRPVAQPVPRAPVAPPAEAAQEEDPPDRPGDGTATRQ